VTMACRVGKFCIWADCGMGKTAMQLEWAHQVHQETGGNVLVLVLAPLAVAHQTVREGSKFGIPCSFAATQDEVKPGITVTNYEKLSHFDPDSFSGVVLSPFAGIGSEGYCSIQAGRQFVGFELKPSYFNCAVKNLTEVASNRQGVLV